MLKHVFDIDIEKCAFGGKLKFTAVIDTVAPNAPTSLALTAATDTGRSTTDGITNNNTPDATGGAENQAIVTLLVDDKSVGTGPSNGNWTISTGKACASNLFAVATALAASPIPAHPS